MKATLTAKLTVERVAVYAEMAWMQRRPELGLLCRAAKARGGRVTLEAVRETLPGLSDVGADNIVRWCSALRLCDKDGALTTLGASVADSDEAPVPEQGVYRLSLVRHPLLGSRAVAASRLGSAREDSFDAIGPSPMPDRGKVFTSAIDPRERFIVRGVHRRDQQPRGKALDPDGALTLRWALDFSNGREAWSLSGSLSSTQGDGRLPVQHAPESAGVDLWALAAAWADGPLARFGRWDASSRRLMVAFTGLSPAESESFEKTLPAQRVEVPGKGVFDGVIIEAVPIGPASADDAQRWAMDRFERALASTPRYRSRDDVRALFAARVRGTPLEPHAPSLPPHAALLAGAPQDHERFWSLAAPVDLSPTTVPDEVLGPYRVVPSTTLTPSTLGGAP